MATISGHHNVQPKGELPVVHMHKQRNAMPARNPRPDRPRNLTGLYLGTDSLDRGNGRRSVPVPALTRTHTMPSNRAKTPTEERSYNKVEMLRVKEEKRGFSGNPVKARRSHVDTSVDFETVGPPSTNRTDTEIWELTRQTTRQFTLSNNNGLSHLEYLAPDPHGMISSKYPHAFQENLNSSLVKEVHQASKKQSDISGLLHCYNKICKGDKDALHLLLPQKRSPGKISYTTTGFSVKRSYRIPHKAELLGNFPPPPDFSQFRPPNSRRPLVPSPYFFKTRNPTRSTGSMLDKIIGAPGTGKLSDFVTPRGQPAPSHHNTPRCSSRSQRVPEHAETSTVNNMSYDATLSSTAQHIPLDHPRPEASDAEKLAISLPAMPKPETSEPTSPTVKDSTTKDTVQPGGGLPDSLTQEQSQTFSNHDKPSGTAGSAEVSSACHGDTNADGIQNNDTTTHMNGATSDNHVAVPVGTEPLNGAGTEGPVMTLEGTGPLNSAETDDSVKTMESVGRMPAECAPEIVVATVDDTDSAHSINHPFTGPGPKEGQSIQIVLRGSNRKEEIAELLNEHAEIVNQISSSQNLQETAKNSEHADENLEPEMRNSESGAGNSEPAAPKSETVAPSSETAAGDSEPAAGKSEPATANSEPTAENSLPGSDNVDPVDPVLEQTTE